MFTKLVAAACLTLATAPAAAQVPQLPSRDVVVLALGSEDDRVALLLRTADQIFEGDAGAQTIRDVQMDIVAKTAPFSPVILVAADERTRSDVTSRCDAYGICDLLASGDARIVIVPHDTVWIRDYGPFVETAPGGTAAVTDATYENARREIDLAVALQQITTERLQLHRLLDSDDPDLAPLREVLSREAIEKELTVLRDRADMFRDLSDLRERPRDDAAAFDIAQTVLLDAKRPSGNDLKRTALKIDGGNLLKTDEGACFTTTAVLSDNYRANLSVGDELKRAFGCREIVHLEALPGDGVIRHVDMFLLPVSGRHVLLADFALHYPHIGKAWKNMTPLERDLTTQAATVMSQNAAALEARGFKVTLVPALTPRTHEGRVYYPTVMNALVRSNGSRLQVLVPAYEGFQTDVQEKTRNLIAAAFGSAADVVGIESTVAARAQGAVHCLTITVPFELAVGRDALETSRRQTWALRKHLDEALVEITRPTVVGRWTSPPSVGADAAADEPEWSLEFADETVTIRSNTRSTSATYVVSKDDKFKWPIELTFEDGRRKRRGRIEWITDRSMRLVLERADPIVLVKALRLEDIAPEAEPLRAGSTIGGVLSDIDPRDVSGRLVKAWRMEGRAGEAVTIEVSSPDFDTEVLVAGPGLDEPLHNDDSADDTHDSRLAFSVPRDGTYTVVLRSFDRREGGAFTLAASTGDQSLTAQLAAIPVEQRALAVGTSVTGRLTSEMAREGFGPIQAWTLAGCQDGAIKVDLKSTAFDAYLIVTERGRAEPFSNDDSDGTLDASLEISCKPGTEYKVIVMSAVESETGPFELTATRVTR
jgi:agmatine/peptidylarginine deiminase